MHVGGVRTALFAWLLAQQSKKDNGEGTFILRIEDTDKVREVAGSIERGDLQGNYGVQTLIYRLSQHEVDMPFPEDICRVAVV